MKDLTLIYRYIKHGISQYKLDLIFYIIVITVYNGIRIIIPYITGGFIDKLIIEESYEFILAYSLLFIGIKIIFIIVIYFVKMLGTKISVDVGFEFKKKAIEHVQNTSLSFTNHENTTEIVQKIHRDASMLMVYVLNFFQGFGSAVICFVIPILFVFSIDIYFGIGILLLFPINYILYKQVGQKLHHAAGENEEAITNSFSKLYEQISKYRFIKINNLKKSLADGFVDAKTRQKEKGVKYAGVSFVYGLISTNMDVIYQIALFIYGGYLLMNHRMSVGDFTVLSSYVSLISIAFTSFLGIGSDMQISKVYCQRLKEIENVTIETNGTIDVDGIETIDVKNLTFSYCDKAVLKNVNQSFSKGSIYAVAGENGKGKSTLIDLMLGLYINEYSGEILYNGLSIQNIDMKKARETVIGVTEQEPVLLNDTVRYNITLGNNYMPNKEQILNLAEKIGFEDYLNSHEEGMDNMDYDTILNLSGGQKQKISLLRTLLKNPKLIVLDEPTSALDFGSMMLLMDYLHEIKRDKIIIIISHDEKVLERCDIRYIME